MFNFAFLDITIGNIIGDTLEEMNYWESMLGREFDIRPQL